MTKVMYKSTVIKNTILPPVEQSYRTIQEARNQAKSFSIPIGAGWSEVCNLLDVATGESGKFISWIVSTNTMYQDKITENVENIRKIPSIEIGKRVNSVKKNVNNCK